MTAAHDLLHEAKELKNLIERSVTGGSKDDSDEKRYEDLRSSLMKQNRLREYIPEFVVKHRTLDGMWPYFRDEFPTYALRRKHLDESFTKLLDELEFSAESNIEKTLYTIIHNVGNDVIISLFRKAIERCDHDPAGAITAANSLLEAVVEYLLDDILGKAPNRKKSLRTLLQELRLDPAQHADQTIKEILLGIKAAVKGLGVFRNQVSDAHGTDAPRRRPAPRHARLAVYLAATISAFLIETRQARLANDRREETAAKRARAGRPVQLD